MTPDIDPEDQHLFRQAVAKLNNTPAPTRIKTPVSHQSTLGPYPEPSHWVGAETILFHAQDGIQPAIQRKLKRGAFPFQQRIDLHGLDAQQAHQALMDFIDQCIETRQRVALVIHGKGDPHRARLKSIVNESLLQHPNILAFSSATPQHGGTGATYLLIKQSPTQEHRA